MATKRVTVAEVAEDQIPPGAVLPPDEFDPEALEAASGEDHSGGGGSTMLQVRDQALGVISGEVSSADIRVPWLKLVYGVGSLAEKFNPGSLVLGDDNLLVEKAQPLNIIILSASQVWKEYLKQYTPGVLPRTYMTEAEVRKNGGTTTWSADGTQGPTFSPALTMKLLIQKPEGITCGLFGLELGDSLWAPAKWSVDKTAYKRVGPTILTTAAFSLRKRGLLSGIWEIRTAAEKSRTGNLTIVPTIRLIGHAPDSLVEQIKAVFGEAPLPPVE